MPGPGPGPGPRPASRSAARRAAAIAFFAIVAGVGALVVVGQAAPAHLVVRDDGPVTCPFRLLTHLRCPLCGMTRATLRMARGDLRGALDLHPLAPLLLLAIVGGTLGWLGSVALDRPLPSWMRVRARYAIALFALVWLVNIFLGHA